MLLRSRFYLPPLRKHCVEREPLLRILENISGGEIALISAPAGYGKTTLVSQWLHRHPQAFCWLSLGSEHNSPKLFWRYAITALQQIQPSIGVVADELASTQPVEHAVISLINDLDELSVMNQSGNAISIVLDDFQAIENKQLLAHINLFLDHLPPSIRLVITSREAPPLSIVKRRAANQLTLISREHLCFSHTETQAFFHNTLSLDLSSKQLSQLQQLTEGWVTGLQLTAISLKQHQGTAEALAAEHQHLDRHIADYLFEEVFDELREDQKQFLLGTALLKRFSPGLCNTMLSRNDSIKIIAELETANLFIVALDNHRTWYRFHDLFRQFLIQHSTHLGTDLKSNYLTNAAQWLFNSGYLEEAIDTALNNADWDCAIHWINQTWQGDKWLNEDNALRWATTLPHQLCEQEPSLFALIENAQQASNVSPIATTPTSLGIEPLTHREQQVLTLVAAGHSNQAIANQLFISLNTLKVHIRNLYGKMGVETRSQAMVNAKKFQ